ncbi:MAG: hypothetical protein V1848_01730 [Candidatus Magasanikbacteria bacterium]
MNQKLRQQLSTIVSPENEKNWYVPMLFEKNTLPQLPKEVILVQSPPEESKNYNCFLYVLKLYENEEIIKETHGFIFSAFFEHLIAIGEMKKTYQKGEGTIVLYKDEKTNPNEFTHAGIMREDGTVISKWSWGPILIHDLFDVPLAYGDIVEYYEPLQEDKGLMLYQKYKEFNRE